jgi:hypothetical protein
MTAPFGAALTGSDGAPHVSVFALGVAVIDGMMGAGGAPLSYQHCFWVPGAGSPNTPLSHGVPPVNVKITYCVSLPYLTSCVPENVHTPRSLAHDVQVIDARAVAPVPGDTPGVRGVVLPGVGDADEPALMAALPAAVLAAVCTIQQRLSEPGAGSPNTLLSHGLPPVSVRTT